VSPPLDPQAFPVSARYVYLNHAGVNAPPRPVVQAMAGWAATAAEKGSLTTTEDEEHIEVVRAAGARLMGVTPEEVAFVKNTTEGLGFVANGLSWAEGDRVVVPGCEFPSAFYPWKALEDKGVVLDVVEADGPGRHIPVSAFDEVISRGPPPRLVAVSWVQFGRGWRTDLAAVAGLAHDAGALLCADVIQGLGVLPACLGEWAVDFAAADAHKWLLGPPGIGLLFVRRDRLDQLRVLEPGWASVVHRQQWENLELVLDDTARRLEGGTANVAGVYGLGAALRMLLEADVAAIWAHVDELCDRLCAGLQAMGATVMSDRSADGRSGIVTFVVPGIDADVLVDGLLRANIVCAPRDGGVRVSPHGYNTSGDIDTVLDALESLVRRLGG
jgi:selenocysteine lyase/cysteine desulfurase